jgi:hypothetical protein
MENKRSQQNFIFLFAGIYFSLMTIVFTRPLINRISTHTVGGFSDNMYFIFQIEWIKRAVFEYHINPLTTNLLNFPYGFSLLTTEIAPLQIIFALPFALLGNPVLGYNISMMGTFFLAGMFMFLWIYKITDSWIAALISGTAYAFLPYHMAHFLIGHLNLSGIQWFPLFFWGLTNVLTDNKVSKKNILLLTLGISGIALTSLYYIYMTLVVSVIILIIYFLFFAREKIFSKNIWKQFIYSVLFSAPILLAGVGPYVYYHSVKGSTRNIQDAVMFSASITDFLLPFTKQVLLGKWVWKNFPRDLWNEATLYLGFPMLVFSIVGWKERISLGMKRLFQIFLIGGITAGILAFGMNVTWMEKPVLVNLPGWFGALIGKSQSMIYLPGYLFQKYLPFYSIMRVPMRYGIFTMVFVCAGGGIGIQWILRKVEKKWHMIIGFFALLIVILDFFNTPFSLSEIKAREVDTWLSEQPYGGLVQLPYKQSLLEEHFYYALHHNKPLLGAVRAFPSDRFLFLKNILISFPDYESVSALKNENITYVVIDEKEIPVTETIVDAAVENGLTYHGSFSGESVFTID